MLDAEVGMRCGSVWKGFNAVLGWTSAGLGMEPMTGRSSLTVGGFGAGAEGSQVEERRKIGEVLHLGKVECGRCLLAIGRIVQGKINFRMYIWAISPKEVSPQDPVL